MKKTTKWIMISALAAMLAGTTTAALAADNGTEAETATPSPAPHKARKDAPPPRQGGSNGNNQAADGTCPQGDQPRQDRPPAPDGRNGGPKGGPNGAPRDHGPAPRTPGGTNTPAADYEVVFQGGYGTDPVDHGRPVVLIAAALGVPTEVFREAFSGVTPAGLDGPPSAELAQRNKAALLSVLAPYGITNDRLDEVSNYYRYNGSKGQLWKITPATATANVTDGVVTGITLTNAGSGYSSAPTITIRTPNGVVTATTTLTYTKDFATNGSVSSITINP